MEDTENQQSTLLSREKILEIIEKNCCNELGSWYVFFPDELIKILNLDTIEKCMILLTTKNIKHYWAKSYKEDQPDVIYINENQSKNYMEEIDND